MADDHAGEIASDADKRPRQSGDSPKLSPPPKRGRFGEEPLPGLPPAAAAAADGQKNLWADPEYDDNAEVHTEWLRVAAAYNQEQGYNVCEVVLLEEPDSWGRVGVGVFCNVCGPAGGHGRCDQQHRRVHKVGPKNSADKAVWSDMDRRVPTIQNFVLVHCRNRTHPLALEKLIEEAGQSWLWPRYCGFDGVDMCACVPVFQSMWGGSWGGRLG
jgi:hypothetical protein